MKRLFIVLVVFGGLFLQPTLVSAHAGPGPPFLKIDGKYADTNQYYQGDARINIPQDLAPGKYLPNQMILFEVDTSQLLVPPDISANTKFRWTLITGKTFMDAEKTFVDGSRIQRSFSHIGSYLLQLEAQGPGEYTYNILDTVQIDVVPNRNYQVPRLSVDVSAPESKNSFTSFFVSKAIVDPTVSTKPITYLWDVGDKDLLTGMAQKISYAASNPISYLYNRIIDVNGLITDVGFDVWKNDKTLEYHPFGNMLKAPIRIVDAKTTQAETSESKHSSGKTPWVKIISVGSGILILTFAFIYFRPKKRVKFSR